MTTGRPVEPNRPDHYHELQVDPNATRAEIRKSYLHLSLKHHPDKLAPNACDAKFKRVRFILVNNGGQYSLTHADPRCLRRTERPIDSNFI
jgi:hypothetical protein